MQYWLHFSDRWHFPSVCIVYNQLLFKLSPWAKGHLLGGETGSGIRDLWCHPVDWLRMYHILLHRAQQESNNRKYPFLASSDPSQPALGPNILPALPFRAVLLLLILPLHTFSLDFLNLLATLSQTYKPSQKIANYMSSSGSSLHVHLFLTVIFPFDWWNALMFWFSDSTYICIVDRKEGVTHEHMQYMDFVGVWIWIYIIFVCMCAHVFRCLSVCARCGIWQYNDFLHI